MSKEVLPIHGDQHCPGGPDPIPCLGGGPSYFQAVFWANHPAADPLTISTSEVRVPYTDWENSDTSVFEPLTFAGGTPVEGTDLVDRVRLLQPGRYVISWGVYFTADFAASVAQYIADGDPIFGFPDQTIHGASTVGTNTFSSRGYRVQTTSRVYPLLDPFGSGVHVPEISTNASVNDSVNRTVSSAWLDIQRESTS